MAATTTTRHTTLTPSPNRCSYLTGAHTSDGADLDHFTGHAQHVRVPSALHLRRRRQRVAGHDQRGGALDPVADDGLQDRSGAVSGAAHHIHQIQVTPSPTPHTIPTNTRCSAVGNESASTNNEQPTRGRTFPPITTATSGRDGTVLKLRFTSVRLACAAQPSQLLDRAV